MPLPTPAHFLPLLESWPTLPAVLLKSLPLLLIAWLLHASLGKRHPQWRVYLWRATAIALLLLPLIALIRLPVPETAAQALRMQVPAMQAQPSLVQVPLMRAQVPQASEREQAAENAALSQRVSAVAQPLDSITALIAAEAPQTADSSVTALTHSANEPTAFSFSPKLLYLLWAAGSLFALCRLLAGAWATRLLLRKSRPVAPHIQKLADEIAASAGVRRLPAICTSDDLQSPALCGVIAPTLLIPARIAANAEINELKAILCHELAHQKARDPFWNLLLQLCAILYWPNPLAWRIRIAHLGACELLADAASARSSGGADAYSQILARIALAVHSSAKVSGLSMARSSKVLHRIRRLPLTLAAAPLRLRSVACALIAFGLFAIGTGSTLVVRAKTESPTSGQVGEPMQANTPRATQQTGISAQQAGYMDVRIINTSGEPLDTAELRTEYSWKAPSPVTAIEKTGNGTFRIQLKSEKEMPGSLSLYVDAAGYVPLTTQWSPLGMDAMPLSYTFQMEPVTRISGRVIDNSGKGIAEAKIEITLYQNSYPSGIAYTYLLQHPVSADAEGFWTCDLLPRAMADLSLEVTHPEYTLSNMLVPQSMYSKLRDGSWTTTLQQINNTGYRLSGIVTLPDGSPAEGAQVRAGWSSAPNTQHWPLATTDAQGRYSFSGLNDVYGQIQIYVSKAGYAPMTAHIEPRGDKDDHDIRLQAGHAVTIKVVDPQGQPLEGVKINTGNRPFDELLKNNNQPLQTNAEGLWQQLWMPEHAVVYNFTREGYIALHGISIAPPGETLTMTPVIQVQATVIDAESGEPIPYFSVQEYRQQNSHWSSYWQPNSTFNSTDGKFEMTLDQSHYPSGNGWRIGVSAAGYMQQEKSVSLESGNPVRLHYVLERGAPITAQVVSEDGTPLPDIEVKLIGLQRNVTTSIMIRDGNIQAFYPVVAQLITDARGNITFQPTRDDYMLIVLREDGYANALYRSGLTKELRLTLTPWAQVSGRLELNPGLNPSDQHMMLSTTSTPLNQLHFSSSAVTDAEGFYRFERVSNDENRLNYYAPITQGKGDNRSIAMSGPSIPLTVSAGELRIIDYNAQGADVVGKLGWSELAPDYEWEIAHGSLNSDESTYTRTQAGVSNRSILYSVSIDASGAFRVNGVQPGTYKVSFKVGNRDKPGEPWQSGITAIAEAEITVPEGKPGAVFDAGTIQLRIRGQ